VIWAEQAMASAREAVVQASGGAMIFVWGMSKQNIYMQTSKIHLAIR
jgi:hypothetical protein